MRGKEGLAGHMERGNDRAMAHRSLAAEGTGVAEEGTVVGVEEDLLRNLGLEDSRLVEGVGLSIAGRLDIEAGWDIDPVDDGLDHRRNILGLTC